MTGRRSGRDESGLGGEQVEGRNAVRELLRDSGGARCTSSGSSPAQGRGVIDEIIDLAETVRCKVRRVDADRAGASARTDAPQGVLAIAAPTPGGATSTICSVGPDAFLRRARRGHRPAATSARSSGWPRPPASPGWCCRSTAAPGSRPRRSRPRPVRWSTSPWRPSGVPALLDRARRAGVWSVGLDADGTADVFALDVADRPLVVVLGAEGSGLGRLTRDRCDLVAGDPDARRDREPQRRGRGRRRLPRDRTSPAR